MNLNHFEKEGDDFYREMARKVGPPTDDSVAAAQLCLERLRNLVLSDRVGFIFNVSVNSENQDMVLTGESERPEFKNIASGVLRQVGFTNIVDRIELVPDLERDPAPFAVTVRPSVMTWSAPDLTGIAMDEALYGEPVYLFKELPGSYLIKNFSGYWGYAAKESFRRLTRKEFIELANAPKVMLTADYRTNGTILPVGCRLPLKQWSQNQTCVLLGPSGEPMEIPKAICQQNNREEQIGRVLSLARSFLGRQYNRGGKNSATGIDCSGLVQLSYRAAGLNLARDAKQQYLSGNLILPCISEALLPGDAVFFMNKSGQVDHTGLYLGDRKILHATGPQVKVQSLDPSAADYFKRFDHDFIGAKRHWR